MKKYTTYITVFICCLALASCGSGDTEVITADSSVTSTSVDSAHHAEAINTDTTTAAPMAIRDSVIPPKVDTPKTDTPKKKPVTTPKKPEPKKTPAKPQPKKDKK